MSTHLLDRLRSATGDAHAALERALDLLQPPLRRERFASVLEGFLVFHRAWEPRVAALLDDDALLVPRRRVALIERDLEALGSQAPASGRRAFDLGYLQSASAAWGSLYVLEGSTLGGQVISKALRGAPWAPEGGLAYFNPFGRRTAAMWAMFRTALEASSPELDAEVAARGACATFQTLQTGLAPRTDAAA